MGNGVTQSILEDEWEGHVDGGDLPRGEEVPGATLRHSGEALICEVCDKDKVAGCGTRGQTEGG